jgi:hypothetical protein
MIERAAMRTEDDLVRDWLAALLRDGEGAQVRERFPPAPPPTTTTPAAG